MTSTTRRCCVPVDPKRLVTIGGPVPVLEGVAQPPVSGAGQFAISRAGTLVISRAARQENCAFSPGRSSGARAGHFRQAANVSLPASLSDGTKIAVSSADEESDVWIWDVVKETLTRLTFGPANETYVAGSLTADTSCFGRVKTGKVDIFVRPRMARALRGLDQGRERGEPQSIARWQAARLSHHLEPLRLAAVALDGSGPGEATLADPSTAKRTAWSRRTGNGSRTSRMSRPLRRFTCGHFQPSTADDGRCHPEAGRARSGHGRDASCTSNHFGRPE